MDLDFVKNKLKQLNTQQTKKSEFLFKPEPGKTVVRMVPYQFNKDNPFLEMKFYYDYAKKTILSPTTFGRPDPINEFAEALKSGGDKDEWILGRKMEPKTRIFIPVIVRGKESEGVKFWGFGPTIYTELLGIIDDPDYGDISDPKNGRDLTIEYKTPAEAGNTYGKITVRVKPNASIVSEDEKVIELIVNGQKELISLYEEPTYDELKTILENHLEGNETEEAKAEDESKSSDSISEKKSDTPKSVSDSFSKLFAENK